MAKKFKKVLLFAAAIGTVAAAAHHYLQKKNAADTPAEDEDYDDFSEEPIEEVTRSRSYVPLTPEPKAEKPEEKTDSFTPLKDTVEQTAEKAEGAIENVEEFFDEEDATDEEPPLKDN